MTRKSITINVLACHLGELAFPTAYFLFLFFYVRLTRTKQSLCQAYCLLSWTIIFPINNLFIVKNCKRRYLSELFVVESSLRENIIFGKIISLSMNPFGESARIYANFELSEDAPNNYLPIIDCKFFVFPIPWITLSDSAALTALIFLQHLVCRYFLIREKTT